MAEIFDYVIVGSGPAGCVLSNRLTKDGSSTVCLMEAGAADHHPYLKIPAGFVKVLYSGKFSWPFETAKIQSLGNRIISLPQGKVLGGSSSINGLAYSRGQSHDYEDWEKLGNLGWGYEDVLPYFKRSEMRLGYADPQYRGMTGELPITDPDFKGDLCERFLDGVGEFGIARNPDYNGEVQDGAGYFQRYISKRWRVSASTAFLSAAKRRSNFRLKTKAEVIKILFEGRTAVGVIYMSGGSLHKVMATKEVLLCAGTINSPRLLQLSGVGSRGLLSECGIETVNDLPGVGENLQDHYTVRISARARNIETINELSKGWKLLTQIGKYALGQPSILSLSPSLVHVFGKSCPSLSRGDIQVLFTPASYKKGRNYELDDFPGMSCGARQQRPSSRGYVRITSNDPSKLPYIQPNYLQTNEDQEVIVKALKIARQLMRSQAMAPYFAEEVLPGEQVRTDDQWLDFAKARGSTGYHLVGTCAMGPDNDPMAVVDATLKVRGLKGLRVVDASIMPRLPSANTLAASLMIGEKAADMIKLSYRQEI